MLGRNWPSSLPIIQKNIVLDCFTAEEYILKTAPIDFAVKHTPEWWKNLPISYVDNFVDRGTTKKCNGIIDYYKHDLYYSFYQ